MSRPSASDPASRRCRKRRDVEFRMVGREAILHDPISAKTHVVNASAAHAWELCDGRTLAELADDFAADYGRPPAELRPDVERIMDLFTRLGLIE